MDLGHQGGLRVLVTAGANGIGLARSRGPSPRRGPGSMSATSTEMALSALAAERSCADAESMPTSPTRAAMSPNCSADADRANSAASMCLVNNAGIAGPTGQASRRSNPEDWDRTLCKSA